MATATPVERPPVVTVIEPPRGTHWPNLPELWRYKDTLYFLARRDIAVRYKQTLIGLVWVILQPIAFALVYTAFLSLIGTVPSQGVPYGVFALTGMTVWLFFAVAMARVSDSTVASTNLIQKIWFPRLIIPLAAIGPAIVDLVASLCGALRRDGHLRRHPGREDPAAARSPRSWRCSPRSASACGSRRSPCATATSSSSSPFLLQVAGCSSRRSSIRSSSSPRPSAVLRPQSDGRRARAVPLDACSAR